MTASAKRDIFTTDKARVIDQSVEPDASMKVRAADALERARAIYGHLVQLGYKKYFGVEGYYRCGFASFYGFHLRGSGATPEEAVDRAIASRLPDDPSTQWDSWVPGSFHRPFEPFDSAPLSKQGSPSCPVV